MVIDSLTQLADLTRQVSDLAFECFLGFQGRISPVTGEGWLPAEELLRQAFDKD